MKSINRQLLYCDKDGSNGLVEQTFLHQEIVHNTVVLRWDEMGVRSRTDFLNS